MGPSSGNIPGLRSPTAEERAWIAEQWCADLEPAYRPTSGKLIRYLGIFFLCFGVASGLRGADGLAGTVVLLIAAAACLGFYHLNRHSDRVYRNRINALKSGSYQVAPAVSVKVSGGDGAGVSGGIVRAELPNGQPLNGAFPIPTACAQALLRQKIHRVSILLIRLANDPEILAIPVPQRR